MARETAPLSTARNRIVAPTGEKMASDHEIGQGQTRMLSSTGDAADALEGNVIERVGEHALDSEHTQMLAFMAEPVSVRIGVTTDPNAEQIFEININGKAYLFRRGETKTVPRFVVDRLARMKETRFAQKEVTDNDGVRSYANVPMTAIKYDFAITGDANPLGASWLAHVLAEQG